MGAAKADRKHRALLAEVERAEKEYQALLAKKQQTELDAYESSSSKLRQRAARTSVAAACNVALQGSMPLIASHAFDSYAMPDSEPECRRSQSAPNLPGI